MIRAADPTLIDHCLLELAAERSRRSVGRAWREILSVMRERGFRDREVYTSIEILKKKGYVGYKDGKSGRKPLDDLDTVIAITPEGKGLLRRQQATMQFNVRLPEALQPELGDFVGKAGDTVTAVAVTAMKEWTRMQKFPGIDFRWTPSGRQPCVTGTGLKVWEAYRIWLDHGGDIEKVEKNYANLSRAKVHVAVAYAQAFINEMPEGAFGKRPPFAREVKV
ncbi:MAG: DUF433 domain-containing protein [Planctomycetes bacterium]|nr:DUF433 domain-containing protein [Planctomycetota bacterium]